MMLWVTCENTQREVSLTCLQHGRMQWFITFTHAHGAGCQILLPLKSMANLLLTFVVPEEVLLEFGLPWCFKL